MKYFKSFLMALVMLTSSYSIVFAKDILVIQGKAPPSSNAATHPPLRMTPDKSELIRLPRSAASIIVGNPAHMNVMADSADTLVIIPRKAGASHFTVLDENGDIIIQQHVIIASPQKNYLRILRTCTKGDESCQSTSVYFCPGSCHEIAMNDDDDANAAQSDEPISRSSANTTDNGRVPSADSP